MQKTEETEALWRAFAQHCGLPDGDYDAFAFGDSPDMATELAALVTSGAKRATASLARDFADFGEPLPRVGDFAIVVDGDGKPQCILRTIEVEIKPLVAVDDRFAWDEGEGNRTRDWWLAAHREFFQRQALRRGFEMHDEIATVFERFEVVWPPMLADRTPLKPET